MSIYCLKTTSAILEIWITNHWKLCKMLLVTQSTIPILKYHFLKMLNSNFYNVNCLETGMISYYFCIDHLTRLISIISLQSISLHSSMEQLVHRKKSLIKAPFVTVFWKNCITTFLIPLCCHVLKQINGIYRAEQWYSCYTFTGSFSPDNNNKGRWLKGMQSFALEYLWHIDVAHWNLTRTSPIMCQMPCSVICFF